MIQIDTTLEPASLRGDIDRLFEASAGKILALERHWNPLLGSPVITVGGRYTSRGWTEWTQGFQFGSAILQFAATGSREALAIGRGGTLRHMSRHVSHVGVHDHGFNNVSTYGNLYNLARSGEMRADEGEIRFYKLALKVSGAVQASRWTSLPAGLGFIYSFNGPHSLFADTIRSLRVLALAHKLGHTLMGENDRQYSLLGRLLQHAETTAHFNVYFGKGRDRYDVRGRVAHESIFNPNDGSYRCPSSQQGYSPFTTWTRGLAWILCGYAEQLEFLDALPEQELRAFGGRAGILSRFMGVARATADFYIEQTPSDGVPYWDTGAPGLAGLGSYLDRPADPFNDCEPVDSSAAAIAAQGLVRLGHFLASRKQARAGSRYLAAGLTIARTIFGEPYLSTSHRHQGLLLHSVYHRPNGWDHVPRGRRVPCGESSMWGDYHARELALLLKRMIERKSYYTFFGL
ncbi:MAG TPA: glycosyl hydrolase [Opitutaceae bacterium]|nr:glycosyl hydrolase [Opitutaceae bacterium]